MSPLTWQQHKATAQKASLADQCKPTTSELEEVEREVRQV